MIIVSAAAALWWFAGEMCENTIVQTIESPDRQHIVTMFERNCGATSGFTTQASVLDHGAVPTGSGNAFVADADHGKARTGEWGGPWAEMRWLSNQHVLIRYARGSRIFEQDEQVSGVEITYQPVQR
ncbi:hypothetical protein [Sphingosinicella sp. BN140058]|uniref:hypothetical protein n=1 Tax=Sphingosinicella sp. BN140058 TaxID=1892855 RepID=UPI001010B4BD|nr:hypothetical protein [Sphingosinicella sp. BN140058]QAY75186.1 hypothetical protein ETR14_00550 [Sphingosinicella sp. BN140058]